MAREKMEILLPAGERMNVPGDTKRQPAPRLRTLEGQTIGILGNSWQCMTFITEEFRERLTKDYGAKEVIAYDTPNTAALPTNLMLDAIARCDAVIVGMGN